MRKYAPKSASRRNRRTPFRPRPDYAEAELLPDVEAPESPDGESQNGPGPGEFQPFISGMPLWGEAIFLAAGCILLYWLVSSSVPVTGQVSTKTAVYLILVLVAAPVASIVYLVRRWVSGK